MSLHIRRCNMREINACYVHLNAHISNEFRLGAFDFVITKYVSIFLKIKDEKNTVVKALNYPYQWEISLFVKLFVASWFFSTLRRE